MEIRPLIDHSAENTRDYFFEKYKVSTENNCVAGGVRFVYDLIKNQNENFPKMFGNAFLIKAYAGEERFKDRREIFDTGVVLQTHGCFYSIFFGTFEGRLVHKSPDIKTMMTDFRHIKPGPWPDGDIVESLFKQVKLPKIMDYYAYWPKRRDDDDESPISPIGDRILLDAIVRRNGKTELKEYNETFLKNQ